MGQVNEQGTGLRLRTIKTHAEKEAIVGIHRMPGAVSFMADGIGHRVSVFVRRILECRRTAYKVVSLCSLLCLLSQRDSAAASYTINVYTSTSTADAAFLATDFIANATSQYNATLAPGLFSNSWKLTISGKNSAYQPPKVSTAIVTLDDITRKLVEISTETYVYGWASGIEYGRQVDMSRITDFYLHCSSPTYFNASTTTWSGAACEYSLMAVERDIYNLKFSSPPVFTGF